MYVTRGSLKFYPDIFVPNEKCNPRFEAKKKFIYNRAYTKVYTMCETFSFDLIRNTTGIKYIFNDEKKKKKIVILIVSSQLSSESRPACTIWF